MRVGLCFDGFYSIQEMIELGQLADDVGMESIWMSDLILNAFVILSRHLWRCSRRPGESKSLRRP